MKKIVILISGRGSLLESFKMASNLELVKVIANKECDGILLAERLGYTTEVRKDFNKELAVELNNLGVEVVVLAGFLEIISTEFLTEFTGKVVNSHPSLLPKFGGHGFYGMKVHQAVIDSAETESGFTIHEVTSDVDAGKILFQEKIALSDDETVESLAVKILELEKKNYPEVVGRIVS